MTTTPHLDHLERFGHLSREELLNKLKLVEVMTIDGATADSIGSIALKELAALVGKTVIITGPSEYHAGSLYGPVLP